MLSRMLVVLLCAFAASVLAREDSVRQRPGGEPGTELYAPAAPQHPSSLPWIYRQFDRPPYTYSGGQELEGWGDIPPEALLDILPFPKHLVLVVVGALKWVATHASLLILGAVLTVGLCTLTPFCHISVERFEQLESLPAEYYRALAARTLAAGRHKYGGHDETTRQ